VSAWCSPAVQQRVSDCVREAEEVRAVVRHTDPSCTMAKSLWGGIDCNAGGDCSGQAATTADQFNKCTLDPKTCGCSDVKTN